MENFRPLNLWLSLAVAMIAIVFNACDKDDDALTTDKGVVIDSVKWATRNVGSPGKFVARQGDAGMFYQWNRKVAYSSTGDYVANWDTANPEGDAWERINDPCPAGWRIPTLAEIEILLDTEKVSNEWTTVNGVNGRSFTDKETGNSLFLPITGFRGYSNGLLSDADLSNEDHQGGYYWSATKVDKGNAYYLLFNKNKILWYENYFNFGFNVRCVEIN